MTTLKPDQWAIYKTLTDNYLYGKLITVGERHCRIAVNGEDQLIDACVILAAGDYQAVKKAYFELVASRETKREEVNAATQRMFAREREIVAGLEVVS